MGSIAQLIPTSETRKICEHSGCQNAPVGRAYFDLILPDNIYPNGWVLFHGSLIRRGGDYNARLYYDLGEGFIEDQFIEIPTSGKGTIKELIWLPANIQRMKFSPMGTGEEFELGPLTVNKIGALEQKWRMARRIISMIFLHSSQKRKLIGLTLFRMLVDLQGTYKIAGKLRAHASAPQYPDWIAQFDTLDACDYQKIKKHIARMSAPPRISLLVFLQTNMAKDLSLSETVESVCAQIYPHWELCIVAAADCDPGMREALESFVRHDARIKVEFMEVCHDTSVMGNMVFGRQLGEYVGVLERGDLLSVHALYCIAAELEKHPDAKLLYSDEDWVNADGKRVAPNFKPDWNPQLLLSQNYLGGLSMFRTDLVRQVGAIQSTLRENKVYDLALRVTEGSNADQIRHIPRVLYHRRLTRNEQSIPPTPNVLRDAGLQALAAHLARRGIWGEVSEVPMANGFRIRYALPSQTTRVSIIIPTRDGFSLLQRCIESIRRLSTYPCYEIIVVDNQSSDPETLAYLDALATSNSAEVLRFRHPFNYSAINNFAMRHARGDVLCLLNNDTEIVTPEWLEEMLGLLYQKRVGVVGAKLLYPNGTVQHGGDLVGVGGVANHAHAFLQRDDPGYQGRALLAQDVSAVTGACLLVWKAVYEELGGLAERPLPVAFNDVDFCLRARKAGYRIVWTPHAELYHHESVSRGKDQSPEKARRARREVAYMRKQWKKVMRHDPFYNPNLSYERPDFSLSHAPRVEKPWQI